HGNSNAKPKNATYGFDRVYFNQDTNEDIYNEVMKPLVGTLLQGYNCSVFAYGSTGSGKTFTMLGGKDSPGLTLLTLRDLYQQLDAAQDDYQSDVIVSYLEVYNEQISDLLNKSSGSLQIRDAGRGNEAVIVNLSEHRPPNVESLLQLLQAGNGNRTQHATDLNAESSRSHAVLQVHISMRDKHTSMETVSRKAKLVMVDLAGSEKGSATGFTGERFREGTNINKSLLSLANCISALSGGKACASFRDSKLTRILKDSLSGNCRTVMVANVSPADTMKEDTLNTLKYASQAKKITLQASQNTMTVQTCLSNFTRVVEEMAEKIEHLQDEQKTKDDLLESQKLELVAKDELIESQKQELEDKDLELRLLQEKVKAQKLKLMKLYQRKQR
ncbi:Kinesin-like protein KIF18B, partial [Orchesella cincta]